MNRARAFLSPARGNAWLGALRLALVALLALLVAAAARAGDGGDPLQHPDVIGDDVVRTTGRYAVPDVTLTRDDGKAVTLTGEMNDGRAVVLNFVFTSCTSICPLTSLTFAQLQGKLGALSSHVHLMSISIDPEQDTPARLREYAAKFGAGPHWQHYTGTVAASVATQRAFNVLSDDKMNHAPITLVRAAPGAPWARIDGFATADQLLAELRDVTAAK